MNKKYAQFSAEKPLRTIWSTDFLQNQHVLPIFLESLSFSFYISEYAVEILLVYTEEMTPLISEIWRKWNRSSLKKE